MKRVQAQKPFIYYETLKQWEIITVVIYALITVVIVCSPFILSAEFRQSAIIFYTIIAQSFFYLFLYVSLRNFRYYLIWVGFGIIQFVLFLLFKGNPQLKMARANPSGLLANTLLLLLLFQLLRYMSIKMQRREFVCPGRAGDKDLIENRKATGTDYLILIIYMGVWFGLTMLSLQYIN